MTDFINQIAVDWARYFWMTIWQNTLFTGFALLVMQYYRWRHPRFVRAVGMLALLKLLLPPLFNFSPDLTQESAPAIFYTFPAIYPEAMPGVIEAPSVSLYGWLFLGWAMVCCAIVGVVAWRYVQLGGIARRAMRFCAAEKMIALPRETSIFLSAECRGPYVIGFFKHRIVLPESARRWSTVALRTTLAHEAAHIRLRDHWINLLQLLAQALFFIHPLVWLLNRCLNEAREIACDQSAAAELQQTPDSYARSLVDLAAKLVLPQTLFLSTLYFAASARQLKKRIIYQLENGGTAMKKWSHVHVLLFCALGMLMLPLSCDYSQPPQPSGETPAAALEVADADPAVVPFDQLTEKPVEIERVAPRYPESAKDAGIEGTVVVKVKVGTDGAVEAVEVLKSVPELDAAATEAARQFRFKPGKVDDKPVKVWLSIPFKFSFATSAEKESVTADDAMPRVLESAAPVYPELAKKAGIEGRVILKMFVDENGAVSAVEVVKSDHEILNQAAVEAAKKYTFVPAQKDGKPVKSEVMLPFLFKLNSHSENKKTSQNLNPGKSDRTENLATVTFPQILELKMPVYPPGVAVRGIIEENVHLNLQIDAQGAVKSVRVLKALRPELVAPIVAAVRQSRFSVKKVGGEAVEYTFATVFNPWTFDSTLN